MSIARNVAIAVRPVSRAVFVVSKSDMRVETYGTVDELNSVLGFARSICQNAEIRTWTEEIQRTLFSARLGPGNSAESKKSPPVITAEDVDRLTYTRPIQSRQRRASFPIGLCPAHTLRPAAFEVARTVCRRAERNTNDLPRPMPTWGLTSSPISIAFPMWSGFFGRLLEFQAGVEFEAA